MKKAQLIQMFMSGFVDESGNPLASGLVTCYDAGTTNAKTVYQNAEGSINHTNPVVLDARGVRVAYGQGAYKFVIADSLGNIQYTVDNVQVSPAGFYSLKFTATTAGQLTYDIGGFIENLERMDVAMNGVMLSRDSWSATDTTLTLDSGYAGMVLVGTEVEVVEK